MTRFMMIDENRATVQSLLSLDPKKFESLPVALS